VVLQYLLTRGQTAPLLSARSPVTECMNTVGAARAPVGVTIRQPNLRIWPGLESRLFVFCTSATPAFLHAPTMWDGVLIGIVVYGTERVVVHTRRFRHILRHRATPFHYAADTSASVLYRTRGLMRLLTCMVESCFLSLL
jgi:hypothetical protein